MGLEKIPTQNGSPKESKKIDATIERESITFEKAAEELIAEARREMIETSTKEGRIYHTQEHPDTLMERAGKVASAFEITDRQKLLYELAIAYHDLIIKTDPVDPDNITAMIKRHRGAREGDAYGKEGNEGVSAQRAEEAMRAMNERAGQPVFSEEDIKTVFFSIEATYPDVSFAAFKDYRYYGAIVERNPVIEDIVAWLAERGIEKGLQFSQPHLEKPLERGERIPPEVLIMILDDLGGAGMASREEFGVEGDKEFRELYQNITNPENRQRLLTGGAPEDELDREKASEEMQKWLMIQVGFVAWQMLRIEKINLLLEQNEQLNTEGTRRFRSTFNRFEDNIKASFERAEIAEKKYQEIKTREGSKQAFAYLTQEMHFEPVRL